MAPGNRFCTHCNRTNHTINTCFIKYGYPLGFKSRKPTAPSSASSSLGFTSAQVQSLLALLLSSAPTTTATISLASAEHVATPFTGSAMELALSLEKLVNEKLLNLHSVADRNNDPQLADFIESEFLEEQIGQGGLGNFK